MTEVYAFSGKVETLDFGRMAYHIVYLPEKIRKLLPLDESPRLRTVGFVSGQPFQLALMPTAGRKWYLLLSRKFLKKCAAKLGDRVDVEFSLDDPDAVDVPPELRHAVETNGRAAQIWEQMTAGKKRGLAYRVATAKRAETRQRRVETAMEEILDFGLERDL
ncbi:MAG: YdeI/OmpD-associated family protein [Planctomycetaceae bacterium]|nr:YdeI/OmpD-associated family protein [Planctomycetaceae bacterium]